jgi:hypothetical protein
MRCRLRSMHPDLLISVNVDGRHLVTAKLINYFVLLQIEQILWPLIYCNNGILLTVTIHLCRKKYKLRRRGCCTQPLYLIQHCGIMRGQVYYFWLWDHFPKDFFGDPLRNGSPNELSNARNSSRFSFRSSLRNRTSVTKTAVHIYAVNGSGVLVSFTKYNGSHFRDPRVENHLSINSLHCGISYDNRMHFCGPSWMTGRKW